MADYSSNGRRQPTPTECSRCGKLFLSDPVAQASLRHFLAKHGPDQTRHEFNDRYEEIHESHLESWWKA